MSVTRVHAHCATKVTCPSYYTQHKDSQAGLDPCYASSAKEEGGGNKEGWELTTCTTSILCSEAYVDPSFLFWFGQRQIHPTTKGPHTLFGPSSHTNLGKKPNQTVVKAREQNTHAQSTGIRTHTYIYTHNNNKPQIHTHNNNKLQIHARTTTTTTTHEHTCTYLHAHERARMCTSTWRRDNVTRPLARNLNRVSHHQAIVHRQHTHTHSLSHKPSRVHIHTVHTHL